MNIYIYIYHVLASGRQSGRNREIAIGQSGGESHRAIGHGLQSRQSGNHRNRAVGENHTIGQSGTLLQSDNREDSPIDAIGQSGTLLQSDNRGDSPIGAIGQSGALAQSGAQEHYHNRLIKTGAKRRFD